MPPVSFDDVVDALLAIQSDAGGEGKQGRVQELLVGLLRRAGEDKEQMRAVLRVLLPAEDRDSVYGMKTRGLMRTMANVLERGGYSQEAALLKAWTPVPCRSRLVRRAVVCAPEIAIAAAAARAEADGRRRSHGGAAIPLTAVTDACDALTAAFLHTQKDGYAEAQVQVLLRLLQEVRLGFNGWLVLVHVLLKRISMGVGLATVLSGLSAAFPEGLRSPVALYSRQRSLRVLAEHASTPPPRSQEEEMPQLQCGVPFRPMTADALRAPYLLKWSFSKEERLRRPLTPVEGRLVIVSSGRWFVPLVSVVRGGGTLTMVNLQDERVAATKSAQRRRHMLLLREVYARLFVIFVLVFVC